MRVTVGIALVAALALGLAWLFFARADGPAVSDSSGGSQTSEPGAPSGAPHSSDARDDSTGAQVTVAGRILDQDGLAFADLRVRARGADGPTHETRTDADGRFELGALPRFELELELGAEFDPAQPLGERKLACALPALKLAAREAPARIDVGTHVLPRSRPYWIEGLVVLDPDWALAKGVGLGDVRIELEVPDPEELGDLLPRSPPRAPGDPPDWSSPPWRATLPETPLGVGTDATFRFAVETPHDPFVLRVRLKRFEPIERLISPKAEGLFAETFRLP